MNTSGIVSEALAIQKVISEELSAKSSMPEKIHKVLKFLADSLKMDGALLYATADENYLELVDAYQAVGYKSNIRYEEGAIGCCAAAKVTTIKVDEQQKSSLISIPVTRLHITIGAVVLIKHDTTGFDEAQTEEAETLSLPLTDLLSSRTFEDYKNQLIREKGIVMRDALHGVSMNKGYGVGKAVLHYRQRELVNIFADNVELEQSKLAEGRRKMVEYIDKKIAQAESYMGNTTEIMEAYRLFALDKGWYKKISADIAKGYTAEAAVEHVYDRLRAFIGGDVEREFVSGDEDIVVIAQSMGPADLMDYNYTRIKALVIEECSPTLHVVIVAKALNIPVVAKIYGVLKEVKAGETVAVNGDEGTLYPNPSESLIAEYQKKSVGLQKVFEELESLSSHPTKTKDDIKINLALNYGLDLDYDYIKPTHCDGIGLYRTEIMFMSADKMPDVETQRKQYARLYEALGSKKIIFRSLDVGSDKFLPYWGEIKEDTPAIGWRSIRITLDRRSILRQQIRAMLRAAADKELNVMFPMISTCEEFLEAKETLLLEYEREKQRGRPTAAKVNVGIMIEVPSLLFQLDEILQQVDFISVGTNDLYQFVFACDRGNPRLTARYDVLSAPFLKLMKMIVDKAGQYKVYCSVCGEMASNPLEAMALIGLGYRNLSVSGASYANVKKMIMSMKNEDVADYVRSLLKSAKTSVRPQLLAYAYDHTIAIN